jgi:hypothetical protein
VPVTRTSNLGCLNMTFTQPLQLLEWTGRPCAKGKVGQIPAEQPSILKQLGGRWGGLAEAGLVLPHVLPPLPPLAQGSASRIPSFGFSTLVRR